MNGLRQVAAIDSGSWQGYIEAEFLPGINDLTFVYNGKKQKIDNDRRELKFALVNFRIEVIDDDKENLSYELIDKTDRIIRKRLHDAGFFNVQGKIIANKGFYKKQLPTSSFALKEFIHMEQSSANIISDYAKNSGKRSVNTLYKCFRKNLYRGTV